MNAASQIAFLRGINLGKRQVKMDALRAAMTACGYTNVATILASGNVIFQSPDEPVGEPRRLEACLQAAFGFPIDVILRSAGQIQALVAANPFAGVEVTPDTRLYVSFLPSEPAWERPLPHDYPGNLRLLRVAGGDVCTVLRLDPAHKTTDAMTLLDKEFGRRITTRNWNTVEKVMQALEKGVDDDQR